MASDKRIHTPILCILLSQPMLVTDFLISIHLQKDLKYIKNYDIFEVFWQFQYELSIPKYSLHDDALPAQDKCIKQNSLTD